MEEFGINPFTNDLDKLKDINSIKDIPKFTTNPFTKDFKFSKIMHYAKKDKAKVMVEDVVITNKDIKKDNLVFAEKLYKDNTPFTKMFLDIPLQVKDTKATTFKLFFHILLKRMNLNADVIIINPQYICEELDMSLTTVYNSIIDLVKAGIIVRHNEDNLYWINPHCIFRGDRKKIRLNKW
jgi:hypothetical protein